MAFNKTGTPAPVSSVMASCGCDRCASKAVCTLRDGRYLCFACLSEKNASETPSPSNVEDGGQDGLP